MISLEIIAILSTIICVIFSAKGHILTWPIGIVSALSLIGIYLQTGLYANIVLQSIFVAQCVFGWYNWGKKDNLEITSIDAGFLSQHIISAISLGIAYGGYDILSNHKGISFPSYIDGVSTALALLGNWYLAKKIIQAWPLFMLYNILIGVLLTYQGIYSLAILNLCLFFISLNGYLKWQKNLKQD